jgi:hypothetical protein
MVIRTTAATRALAFFISMLALAACSASSVAQLLNPGYPRCQASLRKAFAVTLVGRGEREDVAEKLADETVQALAAVELGPKPFKVTSPSGVQYGYFFEREDDRCLLRMVAWQVGGLQYADAVHYLATRPLPGCGCKQ